MINDYLEDAIPDPIIKNGIKVRRKNHVLPRLVKIPNQFGGGIVWDREESKIRDAVFVDENAAKTYILSTYAYKSLTEDLLLERLSELEFFPA